MGKLTPEEMQARLDCATQFLVGATPKHGRVFVETRGSGAWVVSNGSAVLNSDDEWEWEPMPSGRDADFIARTRLSLEDAFARARAALKEAGE